MSGTRCKAVQKTANGIICCVCDANWLCESCHTCQTCQSGGASQNSRISDQDFSNLTDQRVQRDKPRGRPDRQLDRGTLRLFEPTMNELVRKRSHKRSHDASHQVVVDQIINTPDATWIMDELLVHLALLVDSCAMGAERLGGAEVTLRGRDPVTDFVITACKVYRELYKVNSLEFSRDANNGTPKGPLIRFLSACCRVVLDGEDMKTDEAIAADIVKFRARAKSRKED